MTNARAKLILQAKKSTSWASATVWHTIIFPSDISLYLPALFELCNLQHLRSSFLHSQHHSLCSSPIIQHVLIMNSSQIRRWKEMKKAQQRLGAWWLCEDMSCWADWGEALMQVKQGHWGSRYCCTSFCSAQMQTLNLLFLHIICSW